MEFPKELMDYILKIKTYTYEKELMRRCKVCDFKISEWCTMAKCGYCYQIVCESGVYECLLCEETCCYKHEFHKLPGQEKRICVFCFGNLEMEFLSLK